eukprot:354099-Chlamydomonas_euryale.AAC.2
MACAWHGHDVGVMCMACAWHGHGNGMGMMLVLCAWHGHGMGMAWAWEVAAVRRSVLVAELPPQRSCSGGLALGLVSFGGEWPWEGAVAGGSSSRA